MHGSVKPSGQAFTCQMTGHGEVQPKVFLSLSRTESVRLSTMLVLGGSIDAILIYNYGGANLISLVVDLVNPNWRPTIESIGVIIAIFLLPIGLSFLFNIIGDEERLVPPLYMQIVAIALVVAFAYNQVNASNYVAYLLSFYVFGAYVAVGGTVQDRVVVSTVGRTCPRDQIVTECLRVIADADVVRHILGVKVVRDYLGLRIRVWETERGGWLFKSRNRLPIQSRIELVRGSQSNETLVNFAVFERRRYEIRSTPDVVEAAKGDVAYVRDVLQRPEHSFQVIGAPQENAQALVSEVIDEYQGLSERMREMSVKRMVALLGTIVFWGLTGVFAWMGANEAGLATLAIAVYVTYESYGVWREE